MLAESLQRSRRSARGGRTRRSSTTSRLRSSRNTSPNTQMVSLTLFVHIISSGLYLFSLLFLLSPPCVTCVLIVTAEPVIGFFGISKQKFECDMPRGSVGKFVFLSTSLSLSLSLSLSQFCVHVLIVRHRDAGAGSERPAL
jgi:hypothetical protein